MLLSESDLYYVNKIQHQNSSCFISLKHVQELDIMFVMFEVVMQHNI